MSLITNTEVKDYLGITTHNKNTLLTTLITKVQARAEKYIGCVLTGIELTEYYDGDGTSELLLKNSPVKSVTSIHDDTERAYGASTLVDSDDIILKNTEGRVILDGDMFTKGVNNIQVVYKAGYDDGTEYTSLPEDLKLALIEDVAAEFILAQGVQADVEGDGEATGQLGKLSKNATKTYKLYRKIK